MLWHWTGLRLAKGRDTSKSSWKPFRAHLHAEFDSWKCSACITRTVDTASPPLSIDSPANEAPLCICVCASADACVPVQERLKDKRRREEHEFWRRMAQVIPERNYRIWHAFEKGLEKYIVLLQDRSKLIEETDTIRHQNDELRSLLNQYMSAKINEELFSPPQLMVAAPAATQG